MTPGERRKSVPSSGGRPRSQVTDYLSTTLIGGSLLSPPRAYKGFILTARTFQVRGTGRWTLDVLIGRHGSIRSFSGSDTFPTEQDATAACWSMARRIIDRSPSDCAVAELWSE